MKSITRNKSVYHDYEITDTRDAGIVLVGHEVKSIKTWQVNIKDAVVRIDHFAINIHNMDIPLYDRTSPVIAPRYDPRTPRALLLNKKELHKIILKTQKGWLQIMPLELRLNPRGRIKLKIGLAQRLKKVDKKHILKEKMIDRDMAKEAKDYWR